VHKGKHPFHFLKGFLGALSFGTIVTNSIPIVDLIHIFLPKNLEEGIRIKLGVP
jgi:hypothetical protein